jgi:uncharacterized protein DUF4129
VSADPGEPNLERPRRTVPLALSIAALLAVVALAAGGRPLGIGRGGNGPSATFFDYAWTSLVIGFVLWIALAAWYALETRGANRQHRTTRRWWISVFVFTGFVIAAAWIFHAFHLDNLRRNYVKLHQHRTGMSALLTKTIPDNTRTATFRWEELTIVLVALTIVALVLIVRRRSGVAKRFAGLRRRAAAAELAAAFDDAVDDLRNEQDVRKAIIAAYARTERILAAHGLPRRRSDAPLEYLERALLQLDASARSIRLLTDLFERAKFSHHELGAHLKDEAIDALLEVRDELRAGPREEAAA